MTDRQRDRYLMTDGRELKDRLGRPIQLKGVNLGGWLVTEGWMNGQTDSRERWAVEQLEARFGLEKAARLMAAWYDRWITPRDLDQIKAAGFNLLRVPFGWRNLQDAQGNWLLDKAGRIDFSRLDWIVREAEKRGLYIILTLHVWPGQKEDYHLISREGSASDAARARAGEIWAMVAHHYRGNGTIAAFDIVNEPEGSPNDLLQKALYEAVRAQDPDRIVVNESSYYGNYADPYWQNVVWSAHYPTRPDSGHPEEQIDRWEKENGIAAHPDVRVPIFIGELKAPEDTADSAAALVAALNRRGYSWAVWTYKGVDVGGWAAFNYHSTLRYNLATDSYETLYDKWSKRLVDWQVPGKAPSHYVNRWWLEGYR